MCISFMNTIQAKLLSQFDIYVNRRSDKTKCIKLGAFVLESIRTTLE